MQDMPTNIFDFEKYEVKHSSFKNSLLELNKIIDWSSFVLVAEDIVGAWIRSGFVPQPNLIPRMS